MVTSYFKSLSIDEQIFTSVSTLFTDIPMSVGIVDPRANPTQLNTVEFLWDPSKRTSVFIQVCCHLSKLNHRVTSVQRVALPLVQV